MECWCPEFWWPSEFMGSSRWYVSLLRLYVSFLGWNQGGGPGWGPQSGQGGWGPQSQGPGSGGWQGGAGQGGPTGGKHY